MKTTPKIQRISYRTITKEKRKTYLQLENHKTLKDVNEMILQASNDTGNACYGVAKFAEIC